MRGRAPRWGWQCFKLMGSRPLGGGRAARVHHWQRVGEVHGVRNCAQPQRDDERSAQLRKLASCKTLARVHS